MKKGFTFIELLIAVTLMGLTFFPIMSLFSHSLEQMNLSNEKHTALNLAREGIEMLKNKNLPVSRIKEEGSYYYPELDSPPLSLNHNSWRIHTIIHKSTEPLLVEIVVLKEPEHEESLKIVTYMEDLF